MQLKPFAELIQGSSAAIHTTIQSKKLKQEKNYLNLGTQKKQKQKQGEKQ